MYQKYKARFMLILIIPLISLLVGILILYIVLNYNVKMDLLITITILGQLSIMSISIILYIVSIKVTDKEKRYNYIEKQLNYQLNHYQKLKEKNAKIFETVHDYKNHLHCIRYLHNYYKKDQLNQYMDSLLKRFTTGHIIDTGNPVIDALISEKICMAREKEIEIKWDLQLPAKIKIDYIDLCAILGNALDNAIEACEGITSKESNKSLLLSINRRDSYIVIGITNTYDKNISRKSRILLKSASNNQLHGFGCKSIERAVKKYNGNMVVKIEDNLYHLTIIMLIA